jgi:NADP-dependent alcohol dehydrogenase
MGMDTKLSDYTKEFSNTADFIVKRFDERGWRLGEKTKYHFRKVKNSRNEL